VPTEQIDPAAQIKPVNAYDLKISYIRSTRAGGKFASLIRANMKPSTPQFRRREQAGLTRLRAVGDEGETARFPVEGALARSPKRFLKPDKYGTARLRELNKRLAVVQKAFPGTATEIEMCRLACEMLEGAWRERAKALPAVPDDDNCSCSLCARLPTPPVRQLDDYAWRKSKGRPLTVKTWPYRKELDSVLTGGWCWTRKLNDLDLDLGLRYRYEDDILTFHEYERVVSAIDIAGVTRGVEEGLATVFSANGARALVSGLFAAYKRSVDRYWLDLHITGSVVLSPANVLDKPAYALLQTLDCLFWQVAPDTELWQEENLASLVLCRVLDDMADARADAATGEVSNFWLSSMSTHDKALYAACAIALVKYGCMPESHGLVWNSWLMTTTMVWLGLTGRHALWFDGITDGLPAALDCPLCGIEPNSCTGLLSGEVDLRIGPRRMVEDLGEHVALLAERCRTECPQASPLFSTELAAFEAVHGQWHGDVDVTWKILRRSYIAAVAASLAGGVGARDVQMDAGAVGADLFHALNWAPTCHEDTALLAYMFGCAHPHFLWNCVGYTATAVGGDQLDY
jgi:hypothetical protein